jgi:hypothetical protein
MQKLWDVPKGRSPDPIAGIAGINNHLNRNAKPIPSGILPDRML